MSIKKFCTFFFILTISFFCLLATLITLYGYLPSKFENEKIVLIEPGKTSYQIAELLEENNVINNKYLFLIYSKIVAKEKKLIAGEYNFAPKISAKNVIQILSRGESITRSITIPEGLTVYEVLELINNEPRLAGQINEIPKEGTLFPSTYYFKYGDLRSKLIRLMKTEMDNVINELLTSNEIPDSIKNKNELITLASIIEKEAGNNAEKPIIASVFLNRIEKHMKLQADPTVIYALTNGKNKLGRLLRKKDLKYKSDYNTYIIKGLPPGPIACPGYKSLQAALNPSDTDYFYFMVNGKGGHNFSKNFKSHINNINQYRKLKKN